MADRLGQTATWSGTEAGCNKPQNTRPLALFPAKESKELMSEYIPIVEAEVKLIKADGVDVEMNKVVMKATCKSADLSMADGKMLTCLLQLGGAYCTMCTNSHVECHDLKVSSWFQGSWFPHKSVD